MNDRDSYERAIKIVKNSLGRKHNNFHTIQEIIIADLENIESDKEAVDYLKVALIEATKHKLKTTNEINKERPDRDEQDIFPDEESANCIIEFIESQLNEYKKITDLQSYKETPRQKFDTSVKAYSPKELHNLYGVTAKTFNSWLKPNSKVIGKLKGKKYTPSQVRKIFSIIDTPDDKSL